MSEEQAAVAVLDAPAPISADLLSETAPAEEDLQVSGPSWGIDVADFSYNGAVDLATELWGRPAFVGRYGPDFPITTGEVVYLHNLGIKILMLWNGDPNGSLTWQGYGVGYTQGSRAASFWLTMGAYKGLDVYMDVENSFKLNPDFVQGFAEGARDSGMVGGFYVNPINGIDHATALQEAARATDAPFVVFTDQNQLFANDSAPVTSFRTGSGVGDWACVVPGLEGRTTVWQTWTEFRKVLDMDAASPRGLAGMWGPNPPAPPAPPHGRVLHTCALKPKPDHICGSIHTCWGGDVVTVLAKTEPDRTGGGTWRQVKTDRGLVGHVKQENLKVPA